MGASTIAALDQVVSQPPTTQTECYRLMLLNCEGTHVLLHEANIQYSLPEVRIPPFTRLAEQLTSVLRNIWGIQTILLFSSLIESPPEKLHYAMVEACSRGWQVPPDFAWVPIQQATSYLTDCGEASLLQASHAKAVQPYFGVDPAPFSRVGWIHRLNDWVKVTVAPLGIEPTDVSQLNGSEAFSLLRFDTTRKPLWFKAVGKPNLHELPITTTLSMLFPDYLPKILSSDPLLNGWLMESGGETTLRDTEDFSAWRNAVCRLAELQIASISHTSQLSKAGCRDLCMETLSLFVDPFFEAMAGLMQQQTKNPPPPLTRAELTDVASALTNALDRLGDIGIPYTLGHSDFNPGNILVEGNRCVFTDWAEAYVGHPFLTFEYLLAHLRISCPTLVMREDCLREAYTACWRSTVCSANIERALQLSPLIAVYANAISSNSWRDPERLVVPQVPGYLRSLTRRMRQESGKLHQRKDLMGGRSQSSIV
jgi:hypothetical protein